MSIFAITFQLPLQLFLDFNLRSAKNCGPRLPEVELEAVALPWIDEADYPAFQALIVDLPATHKVWVERQRTVAAFLQVRGGAPELAIDPASFRWHLWATGRARLEQELWIMAAMWVSGVPPAMVADPERQRISYN
ncbi:hypothetical protein [Rhodopila sp.]|uniref:hypothetical protein n=1 Tax=Rhodopila sp. TaxID=2480087 RepID=UPI003D0DDC31